MRVSHTFNFFCILLCCLLFASCGAIVRSTIKEDDKQIPLLFGKNDEGILAIRKGKRSFDRYLEKNFEKYYFGKYKIIDKSEMDNPIYQSDSVYRYIFVESIQYEEQPGGLTNRTTYNKQDGIGTSFMYPDRYAHFGIKDRQTGKIYFGKVGSGAFSKVMKAYLQSLEKIRIKNSTDKAPK